MDIPRGTDTFEKGTWRRANRDGHIVVNLCCPICGSVGTLNGPEGNHAVSEDGTVSPSVHCNCGFHQFVKLLDYYG